MNISEHFTIEEVKTSSKFPDIARNMILTESIISNAKKVCIILEIIRAHFNKPIIIDSWYRDAILNKKVGGVPDSSHGTGGAVDFIIKGVNMSDVMEWIVNNHKIEYEQLIYYPKKGHIHLDVYRKPRMEKLVSVKNGEYTKYVDNK